MDRPNFDDIFMSFLDVLVKRCVCLKLQTAAILVRGNDQILGMGYNGTNSGMQECCDYWRQYHAEQKIEMCFADWICTDDFRNQHKLWSVANEFHAEVNALKYVSKRDIDASCILYMLYSPCINCAKHIISHNIKTIYYKYKYKHSEEAFAILQKAGVVCVFYNNKNKRLKIK